MLESHNKVIREPHDDDIAVSLRLPPLLDPQVQYVVQVDIGQQRRDAAALNCTYLTHYPLTVLQHARIEPFLDQPNHAPVRYPILDKLHQPFMPQRVEEALKIGIQYPVHLLLPDPVCQGVQRGVLAPLWPESVRKS